MLLVLQADRETDTDALLCETDLLWQTLWLLLWLFDCDIEPQRLSERLADCDMHFDSDFLDQLRDKHWLTLCDLLCDWLWHCDIEALVRTGAPPVNQNGMNSGGRIITNGLA